MDEPVVKPGTPPRDKEGKFIPTKRPLEFTWQHFILEIGEVMIAILLAQIVTEGFLWMKMIYINGM